MIGFVCIEFHFPQFCISNHYTRDIGHKIAIPRHIWWRWNVELRVCAPAPPLSLYLSLPLSSYAVLRIRFLIHAHISEKMCSALWTHFCLIQPAKLSIESSLWENGQIPNEIANATQNIRILHIHMHRVDLLQEFKRERERERASKWERQNKRTHWTSNFPFWRVCIRSVLIE